MRRITDAAPGAVLELLRRAPLSPGKAAFAWRLAVGPGVERATTVELEGRVLVVTVGTRAWARELRRSSAVILGRLARSLGEHAIEAIDIRVGRAGDRRAPNPQRGTPPPEP